MRVPGLDFPWFALGDLGLENIICLTSTACAPTPRFGVAHIPLYDLFGGGLPPDPRREEISIHEAADVVLRWRRDGKGTVVHCAGGRGRTGTVLGVTLVKLGLDAEDAIRFLDSLHRRRGKPGWPESAWQADVVRRAAR